MDTFDYKNIYDKEINKKMFFNKIWKNPFICQSKNNLSYQNSLNSNKSLISTFGLFRIFLAKKIK